MKKGFVALLIVLALVVLISPGIVGRLAEQSMDQDIEWAATENDEVTISSEGFVRGWFSSEGRHRIELLTELDEDLAGVGDTKERRYPTALLIDTRIDHGLIPLTSMSRERGSLVPGLGSAVSTLSLELSNGEEWPIAGTVYSEVGITGELESNFILESDNTDFEGRIYDWSDVDFLVTSNPANGAMSVVGGFDSLSMTSPQETIRVGKIAIDGDQEPGPYGFPVGSFNASMRSLSVQSAYNDVSMGSVTLESDLAVNRDRVDARARFLLNDFQSSFGAAEIAWDVRIEDADAEALGKVMKAYEVAGSKLTTYESLVGQNSSLLELLAAGMELHFDRFDMTLPEGAITSKLNLTIGATDAHNFSPAAALLALDGTLDLKMSPGLVDWLTEQFPEFGAVVNFGYLKKSGDEYETYVEIRNGVLTINGAPMQIPMSAFQ